MAPPSDTTAAKIRVGDAHGGHPGRGTYDAPGARLLRRVICCGGLMALCGTGAQAQGLRLATWDAGLSREGPALLLRDLQQGKDDQISAVTGVLAALHPDVLLLTGFDWDYQGRAVAALQDRLRATGLDYGYFYAPQPNTGLPTGLDMDGNGQMNEPRDAQGYGRFTGEKGMVLLSRLPIRTAQARDYSAMLWRDLPGNITQGALPIGADVQRLSTTGHWVVPVDITPTQTLNIMAFAATPPVFDGPEDRNGRRNHDETAFWLTVLDQQAGPFVIMGDAALDPADGDGRPDALRQLLADPRIQDPRPTSQGARAAADPGQAGDPALDTADYNAPANNLRVDYVLPSVDLHVTGAGVVWPLPGAPLADLAARASRHKLVWVDISMP